VECEVWKCEVQRPDAVGEPQPGWPFETLPTGPTGQRLLRLRGGRGGGEHAALNRLASFLYFFAMCLTPASPAPAAIRGQSGCAHI
jgi:hypothetical protein